MSEALGIADAIKAKLETVPTLAGVDVIVDRQKDLAAMVSTAVGKAKGAVILILWTGGTNDDPDASGPRLTTDFEVSVYCTPVIRKDEAPADDIAEAVAKALHLWTPPGGAGDAYEKMIVRRVTNPPDPKYLVYQIDARLPVQL